MLWLAVTLAGLVLPARAQAQVPRKVVSGMVRDSTGPLAKATISEKGMPANATSSGPDGEFVFSVHHLQTVDLAAGIAGLPGFESKITSQGEGAIEVVARDPEAND